MSLQKLVRTCSFSIDNTPLKEHYHDEYELLYVKKGHAKLCVESKNYTLSAGTLVFLSRQEDHRLYDLSCDYERYFVIIYANALDLLISHPWLSSLFRNRPTSFSHIYNMLPLAKQIEECFVKMVSEFQTDDAHSQSLFSYFLQEVLIYTERLFPNSCPAVMTEIDEEIHKIQMYIDKNCFENIKIAEIAAKHYISSQYLTSCFRKRTGYSPKQYLTNTRMSLAKSLLLDTTLPVQTICFKCGFGDVNNFIRLFKKHTGTTPNKYRKSKSL